MEEDLRGLAALKNCLLNPTVGLTSVDLLYNRIGMFSYVAQPLLRLGLIIKLVCSGEAGANVLTEALTPDNTKIKEFLVDLTLPLPLFEQLFRRGGGKAKGKGKKGKKGKK